MKQVLNNLRTGEVTVSDIPVPKIASGQVLIQSINSVISVGTEKMLVNFGRSSYLQKARSQPDKVRMVIDKVKTDGVSATYQSVKSKLDQPMTLGSSNVGTVIEVGAGVKSLAVGDLVLSNGPHAEYVRVPENLCARVPDGVDAEQASYGVLGSIALQGVRLAEPTLGETVVVVGLGLLGLIAVQILRANGCRVVGIDVDEKRVALAETLGAHAVRAGSDTDPVDAVSAYTQGRGADAVLLTLATDKSGPVSQAAHMLRKRGRIVLVGVTGLDLSGADFYEKELSFQVSCSYGPGRYDDSYELEGNDYPIGFVRWTQQRNFEAVLELMRTGALDTSMLTSQRVDLAEVSSAYEELFNAADTLGVVIRYAQPAAETTIEPAMRTVSTPTDRRAVSDQVVVGMVGAGAFAGHTLIPALAKTPARLKTVVSSAGVSGTHLGTQHGFEFSTTDFDNIINDGQINAVVIAVRHDQHARMAIDCLEAGKSVFVEKPLALDHDELDAVVAAFESAKSKNPSLQLMVGYNRRYSPVVSAAGQILRNSSAPSSHVYLCNAGEIDVSHWTQDVRKGGGRIIGEACHMIDLLMYLANASEVEVRGVNAIVNDSGPDVPDTASIDLRFDNGSIGTVHYFANGSRQFPKERITSMQNGGVLEIDNFRTLRTFGLGKGKDKKLWRQDKGHAACIAAFIDAVSRGSDGVIPITQLISGARAAIDASAMATQR